MWWQSHHVYQLCPPRQLTPFVCYLVFILKPSAPHTNTGAFVELFFACYSNMRDPCGLPAGQSACVKGCHFSLLSTGTVTSSCLSEQLADRPTDLTGCFRFSVWSDAFLWPVCGRVFVVFLCWEGQQWASLIIKELVASWKILSLKNTPLVVYLWVFFGNVHLH